MEPLSERRCKLCGTDNLWQGQKRCHECEQTIHAANEFSSHHCIVPKRYRQARTERQKDYLCRLAADGRGLLLRGLAGTGKTWEAFGILEFCRKADPRLKQAYCSWPELLLELRHGYSVPAQAEIARESIEALRGADVAFLDDLGAEKFTESNLAWLQETLYVILDYRYNWTKPTILTTNLEIPRLAEYLGPRLASRILGMCEVVELVGKDRRLE